MSLPARTMLLLAVATALLVAAPSVLAGTKDAPEWKDPANDQATNTGDVTPCDPTPPATNACFQNADLLAGWIDTETATTFNANMLLTGTAGVSTLGTAYDWDFVFSIGGTAYAGRVHLNGAPQGTPAGPADGKLTFSAVCSAAAAAESVVTCTINKADVGNPKKGDKLTGFGGSATAYPGSGSSAFVSDAAPAPDPALDYVFKGAASAAGNATGNSTAGTGNVTTGGPSGNTTSGGSSGNATASGDPGARGTGGGSPNGTAAADAAGAAGNATSSSSKSPAPAWPVVVVALGGVVALVRRRRA